MKYNKCKCSFVLPALDLFSILDAVRVADIVIGVVDGSTSGTSSGSVNPIDDAGQHIISTMLAAGCPELICCIDNDSMKSSANNKQIERVIQSIISCDTKVIDVSDASFMSRHLCTTIPKDVGSRSIRSYMISDDVTISTEDSSSSKCTVRVGGYLRGKPMNINTLAHVVGVGSGRVQRVEFINGYDGPFSARQAVVPAAASKYNTVFGKDADPSKQDSLDIEATSDTLMGEQTWPLDSEMNGSSGEDGGSNRRLPTNIPEGMSSYQADWFVDDDGEWEDDGIDNNNNDADDKTAMSGGDDDDDRHTEHIHDEDDENMTMGDNMTIGNESIVDTKAIAADKHRLRALADDDEVFPDEMDTPVDVSARKRFARYRALQSFRSSPWHAKENLPRDYARIFQFANFSGVQRRAVGQAKAVEDMQMRELAKDTKTSKEKSKSKKKEAGGAMAVDDDGGHHHEEGSQFFVTDTDMTFVKSGQYVYITLTDVPIGAAHKFEADKYLLLSSLLTHENKLSVLHFTIQRHAGCQDLVKAKDKMLIYAGFRCFWARPLYSEPNLNCDKHKLERFLRHDRFSVASVYGPTTFMPCPILMFKDVGDGNLVLVASGSMSSVDPDRIILKKIVLTGIPIRVRKRFAVVKHLFHDPQDVTWFKPAELVTKRGLRGHIKESVGTHGLLKALFSGPVTQNDTVMLILYKRVFPKLPHHHHHADGHGHDDADGDADGSQTLLVT